MKISCTCLGSAEYNQYIVSYGIRASYLLVIQYRRFFSARWSHDEFFSYVDPIHQWTSYHQTNYLRWRAQVLSAIHAAQLDGLLTSTEKVPEQYISVTNDDKAASKEINPA
jgi:hypothetical protein